MNNSSLSALAALLIGGYLTTAAIAQPNILDNGNFEADPEGTTVNVTGGGEVNTITGWRYFAVNGATASATVTSAAGRTGRGLELVRYAAPGSDSALDKDDSSIREAIPAEERIYKLTIDARDGGVFNGTTWLSSELQFPDTTGRNVGKIFDPAADWETFGLTARSGLAGQLSTRFNMLSEVDASVYLDNATVVDATYNVNRIVNGGFENSSTRTLNWRYFDQNSPSGSVALSSDAHTGSRAVLFSVTEDEPVGDVGFDLEGHRIATLGGETLTLSFAAKTADTTNEFARLNYRIAAFDSTGNFVADILDARVAPPSDQYGTYSFDFDVPASATQLNLAFRTYDELFFGPGRGSFLIDDVSIIRQLDASGADFDSDGDVDGRDFLVWQRGGSPNALSAADLATWQEAYGDTAGPSVPALSAPALSAPATAAVPEPASLALGASVLLLAAVSRRRA